MQDHQSPLFSIWAGPQDFGSYHICANFGLSLLALPYFVYAGSECFDKTACMCTLV